MDIKYSAKDEVSCVGFKVVISLQTELSMLIDICSRDLEISRSDLSSTNVRNNRVSFGRSLIFFILRYRYDIPILEIARLLGCAYSVVYVACHKYEILQQDIDCLKSKTLEASYIFAKQCRVKTIDKRKTRWMKRAV